MCGLVEEYPERCDLISLNCVLSEEDGDQGNSDDMNTQHMVSSSPDQREGRCESGLITE